MSDENGPWEPVGPIDTICLLIAPLVLPIAIILVVVYIVDWIRGVLT